MAIEMSPTFYFSSGLWIFLFYEMIIILFENAGTLLPPLGLRLMHNTVETVD